MPIFLQDGRSVLFIHVPKTGGTTVDQLFERSGWAPYARETRRTAPDLMSLLRCSPQHYHGELLKDVLRLDRFDLVFMVVRDPIARFRSEYLMRNRQDPRTDAASVQSWATRAFDWYRSNPFAFDNHLRPQSAFHVDEAIVYRLEDGMDGIVADLNRRLGINLTPLRKRRLHGSKLAGVPSSAVEVTDDLAAQLADFYRSDYEQFGYPLPGGQNTEGNR